MRGRAGLLAVVAAAAVLYGGLRAFEGACRGDLDAFGRLAATREAVRAAGGAPTGADGPLDAAPRLAAAGAAGALDLLLAVKQSHAVAFPAHAAAATAVELAGCSEEAVGAQWRKAASHAWAELPARLAADGLARSVGPRTPETLRAYRDAEPWHATNLARVEQAYRALGA